MKTYTELYENIRKTAAAICGDGAAMSYPVPVSGGERGKEIVFIYPTATFLERTRPYAVLMTAMDGGAVLLYQNCYDRDWFAALNHPFGKKISYALPEYIGGDVKVYKELQARLRSLYDQVREFAFAAELTAEQEMILREYLETLRNITPEDLIPFYREMGKEFSDWTEEMLK